MYFRFPLLLTLLSLCILFSCKKETTRIITNDYQQYNLKGKVKSISEINYSANGKYRTIIQFDEQGFIKEQASYNPDGSLIRKWVNEYNSDHLKVSRSCYVGHDSLSYILRYYYNRQGKLIWTKLFDSNNYLESQYSTEYDDSLNIVKETFLGDDASYKNLVVHTYNDQNKIKEDLFLDTVRNHEWKQLYHYNDRSQLEEIILQSPNDSILNKTKYTYLSNNKVDKVYHYNAKMELESITDYNYDSMDNIVEILEITPDNITRKSNTYQYNYDKNGNWTFLSETENHKNGNIITRKIEYYN
ncbi:MAG TPA: hypothetical protein VK205_04765 [Prolixibacteraceae bacterium]|nr:hypothetical protein [Prolixibacteraceae bacterium]